MKASSKSLYADIVLFNGHGDNPGVSASDKGFPSSPSASSSQAHSVDSELQSVTLAPTGLEQQLLAGELNVEARKLAITDRSVGSSSKAIADFVVGDKERPERLNHHNNDKSSLFAGNIRGGNFITESRLHVMDKEGEIKEANLGRTSAGGPEIVFEDGGELEVRVELGLIPWPSELHVVD
ncbi:hypothetical protein Ancab_003959 [Ancistrocladus abbreviatus]